MGTEAPAIATIPVRCAPKEAPGPKCGTPGRRERVLPPRRVRTVAYQAIAYLEIIGGEYPARCGCCTTSRNSPDGALPRAAYDNGVRELVPERIIEGGMSIERALQSLRRESLLDPSPGFVSDALRDRAARLDMAAHRRGVTGRFSGSLCVDGPHPGRFTLLPATDPIGDLPVAFAPVGADDRDPMRRSLRDLKDRGPEPATVITDGSDLYPARPAELGPDADHQLCAFHNLEEINGLILAAARRLRKAMARRGRAGRKTGPGRKGAERRAAARRAPTKEEKAASVFRHRHLIVERREDFRPGDREDPGRMPSYLPESAILRYFADQIHRLFDAPEGYHQASCRLSVIVRDARFRAAPERVKAPERLGPEEFPRIMAYLNDPVGRRVRTNNHVERASRMIRLLEKVRYKWRRRKAPARFVVLRLDWIRSRAAVEAGDTRLPRVIRRPTTRASTGQQPC